MSQLNLDTNESAGYEALIAVLERAVLRSSQGKGKERHANGKPYHEQPIMEIGRITGEGFAVGQVLKKIQESMRMTDEAAVNETLDAICYLAARIILIEEGKR